VTFFEDVRVGDRSVVGRHTFTAEDIKNFGMRFDPQPFHVDEAAAAETHFGALAASGWHTATVFMRLFLEWRRPTVEAAQARGEPVARMGPALGVRELTWLRPVYAGDTLDYAREIVALRVSGSRPAFGLVTTRVTGTNQRGELTLSFVSTSFLERRGRD
jgi:acyl dehydratase